MKRSLTVKRTFFLPVAAGFCLAVFPAILRAQSDGPRPQTFCNPVDVGYRFQLKEPSHREAADPSVVYFQGEFWLFASKSGGYWHSKDLAHWEFVAPSGLPLEDYAPTVEVIKGRLYFTAFGSKAVFTTEDPAGGEWQKVADCKGYGDPALFYDTDGKLYMFSGCSPRDPLRGVELNPVTFVETGTRVDLFGYDQLKHGWETKHLLASDEEILQDKRLPYLEGAWMTKYKNTYYLQYSAPGTEMDDYSDGVYTSDKPLGPYTYAPYNPFSRKATGFIRSAGHGSTFQDEQGNYWHAATMLLGVRQSFERRLGIFPAGFVASQSGPEQMVCQTYLGDYPQYVPGAVKEPLKNNSPGWMLLCYKKPAEASSSLEKFSVDLAFDENIKTWWSAQTGDPGEWLSVDLGKPCQIEAVQFNFGDQDSVALDRLKNDAYQYLLEVSDDGKIWTTCIDRKNNTRDAPNEYVQLEKPVNARYARLTNVHTPGGAKFSVSGLRLFGNGLGKAPKKVTGVSVVRQADNRRLAKVSWNAVAGADFYIVRYGISPEHLYSSAQVYGTASYDLSGLNTEVSYALTVDAVNDSGITVGTVVVAVP